MLLDLARKKQRRPYGAPCLCCVPRWLRELDDVLRRRALLALHDFELDALALGEGLEALRLDCGVMHEAVLLAVFGRDETDRKSTRLNSSHTVISYAVFCLKKKKKP